MIRKLCMMLALVLAMTGFLLAPRASAQGTPTCSLVLLPDSAIEPSPSSTPDSGDDSDDTDSGDTAGSSVSSDEVLPIEACAPATAYPGPFTTAPTTPTGPYAAPHGLTAIAAQPAPVPVATSRPSADLAHSGSETFVLAYLGTGLLAFGAVALGIRRGAVR